jgi:activator of HSP90 ATPase
MKTKTIRQSVIFNASPHEIYEMLMDSEKHSEFTESPAKISRKVGGRFSTWDDYSTGTNIELVQDKKIVQKWRASDWPEGHYSVATFEFEKVDGKTKLTFTQIDVPEDQYEAVSQGWKEFYWEKMKDMINKKR